ncbi:hypothetical protein K493DRAFT_309585 [Basidiobolus meristosporus CBS 931.73]|uniref:Uncharacterized protein n=1 Tax=Basidiobolus meristosporus CBS 931.73 TaxID=1314790 RepID=A0A1Y1VSV0_9FUNG|nr:hypothetical protein K493DRAFT_309585 [Basidiobolus meristosporus CBS 931.73]|eukprot:ORX64382.1 hypothetical protein K493DRAFT_309585 [Basidiobolus meristosporus CBS 931.73]
MHVIGLYNNLEYAIANGAPLVKDYRELEKPIIHLPVEHYSYHTYTRNIACKLIESSKTDILTHAKGQFIQCVSSWFCLVGFSTMNGCDIARGIANGLEDVHILTFIWKVEGLQVDSDVVLVGESITNLTYIHILAQHLLPHLVYGGLP